MTNLIKIEKKWCFRIGIILILIASLSYNIDQFYKRKVDNMNITSLTDSLYVSKNKLGEEVKSKTLLIMSVKELKKTNNELVAEINKLSNKDKRNLVEINKLNFTVDMLEDSVNVLSSKPPIIVNDTTTIYPFEKTNAFRDLKYYVNVIDRKNGKDIVTSAVTNDKVFADLIITKKKEQGNLILSVSSSNPYININSILGSVVNIKAYNEYQKPKKFGIGLHLGYGISTHSSIVYLSPYIGIGLNYNFIRF